MSSALWMFIMQLQEISLMMITSLNIQQIFLTKK
jgi:hypothetical protein